jgi:hypothetical protein
MDNTMLVKLEEDWQIALDALSNALSDARLAGYIIADVAEQIKLRDREIERLEGAAVLEATSPLGAINGTNESTRKKQTVSLLETLRNQPEHPIKLLYEKQEYLRGQLDDNQRQRDAATDAITINKLKLEHVNALLRALAN